MGYYEFIWPPNSVCIVPIDKSRVSIRESDGATVALFTPAEAEDLIAYAKALGIDKNMTQADILSVRTTTWLIRSDNGDVLLVRSDACNIKEIARELEVNPDWRDREYFIYPVVNGMFKVTVALNGFCIPVDRRILNQSGRVVVDPDVPTAESEVMEDGEGF